MFVQVVGYSCFSGGNEVGPLFASPSNQLFYLDLEKCEMFDVDPKVHTLGKTK